MHSKAIRTFIFWLLFGIGLALLVGFLLLFFTKGMPADATEFNALFRTPTEQLIGFLAGPTMVGISIAFRKVTRLGDN